MKDNSMFEQVESQKLYMQIANQIRQLIANGKLTAGQKLPPERVLTQEFGASRASIREALSALELLGLIECKSGQGNFIKASGKETSCNGLELKDLLKSHSPHEIFEARLEIEPIMAALAAGRGTPENIVKLSNHLKNVNSLGRQIEKEPQKMELYMEADRIFHLEIARTANSSVLFTVFAGVNYMMKEKLWRKIKQRCIQKEGNPRKFEIEHSIIFETIRDRNPDLARVETRKHIEDIRMNLFD